MTKEGREKLARMILDKSRSISDGIKADNLFQFRHTRDKRIQEYFGKMGFERVYELDPDGNHFHFQVTANIVMKVEREIAEKLLVLGMP